VLPVDDRKLTNSQVKWLKNEYDCLKGGRKKLNKRHRERGKSEILPVRKFVKKNVNVKILHNGKIWRN
jgi:hypothetical protein